MHIDSDNIFVLLALCICGAFLLIISFIVIQIRNQNKLLRHKKALDEAEIAHQKELLYKVIRSQEEDRKRIGQNLHDDVGSDLAVLKLRLVANAELAVETPLLERVIDNVRTISHQLSPQMLLFLGLYEVLEELCDQLTESGAISANFTFEEKLSGYTWPEREALAIYRVTQELVANTLKHSGATQLNIILTGIENFIVLDYHDNGRGIQGGKSKGIGTANIISRLDMIGASWIHPEGPGYRMEIRLPYAHAGLS